MVTHLGGEQKLPGVAVGCHAYVHACVDYRLLVQVKEPCRAVRVLLELVISTAKLILT